LCFVHRGDIGEETAEPSGLFLFERDRCIGVQIPALRLVPHAEADFGLPVLVAEVPGDAQSLALLPGLRSAWEELGHLDAKRSGTPRAVAKSPVDFLTTASTIRHDAPFARSVAQLVEVESSGRGYPRIMGVGQAHEWKTHDVFRRANERLLAAVRDRIDSRRPIPFLCECLDPACRSTVALSVEQFRELKNKTNRYAIVADHPTMEGERVIHTDGGVSIVEKNA